jgi:amino acid adenylation domain-containing protein/thioester reductase-like protein
MSRHDPTAARWSQLSDTKQTLLKKRLLGARVGALAVPGIPRRQENDPPPLSFAQQRLWFLDQLEPGSSSYNMPAAIRLYGPLDIAALERSLHDVVQRHESLRTIFVVMDGRPVQVIAAGETPVFLAVVDLRTRDDRDAETQRLAMQEARQPFDLAQGPLFRACLLQLGEHDHILLLTIHHSVCDGWSLSILIRELTTLYGASVDGRSAQLPALPIHYADFAAWQREWLRGEGNHGGATLQRQLTYWRQQLGGNLPVLHLPTDHTRPAVSTYQGAHEVRVLPLELSEALGALGLKEGVTQFMLLLAAFQSLLFRYTHQEDILVGSPIAGRNWPEVENLIGFFTNTLVLRADLSGNPSFRELLRRVREVCLGAYAHQDLPFEKLVEELNPARDLSRNPLFQAMFALQNAPIDVPQLPGLEVRLLQIESGTAMFDLSLDMAESADGLVAVLEYSTALFEAPTIARMLEHFQVLLEGIAANPDQRIANVPLLTERERCQLLVEWNATATQLRPDHCVHQLIEAQAAHTPAATAVVYEDQRLIYGQLNARANQLAHYLRRLGVGPEKLVGVCVERSPEMLVTLLAIFKAGGAYVPLDPAYPVERLAFMLADSQVHVLLTSQAIAVQRLGIERSPESPNAKRPAPIVVYLDDDWPTIAQQPGSNLDVDVGPHNLAYVIYTSGSTGQAKGVMISHRSLVSAYLAWEDAYELRTAARIHLQMASFSFDVFTGDLVRALCSGGTLVLCRRELLLVPHDLYALMRREQIQCAEFVPAVLRNLADYLEESGQRLDFMHLLICGSDSWYVQEYRRFQRLCGPHTRLINSFGLTEATIDSTFFESGDLDLDDDQFVPIGRPFANTWLYILDAHRQPTPIGVPGEVYVGGIGVARGYLGQSSLTAERFIPDTFATSQQRSQTTDHPFVGDGGYRLYRTGDWARYLPDGNIEFLSRIDYQLKVRGFRVEPGEIEAVLRQHPAISGAVVLVHQAAPGDARLVAYVVPSAEHRMPTVEGLDSTVTSELRAFLRGRLPDYMVPSAFVLLAAFPITPNGKIDRQALPAPNWTQRMLAGDYVPPCSAAEAALADLWARVLGVGQVGIHDNFFDLGGHSLLAAQLIFEVREALGVVLPLRCLFEAPTVAEMARLIEGRQGSAELDEVEPIDLRAEVDLDPAISAAGLPVAYTAEPTAIFLTGASGFLGVHLLHELLKQTYAQIYCLVRATTPAAGMEHLRRTLEDYLLWDEALRPRITPIVGDLSQPLFGLSEAAFQQLAGTIDIIYHCAAWVNFTYPYEALKATNVFGTQEILRLASRTHAKPVHFVSSLSVFPQAAYPPGAVVQEDDPLEHSEGLGSGYAQSKWVGEKLLKIASGRGIPISVYRPEFIGGHSQTGIGNAADFVWAMIKGCIQLGSAPDLDILVDVVPVDFVCRAIVHLSRQPESLGRAFHLINDHPLPYKELIDWLRAFGYSLQQMPYNRWLKALDQSAVRGSANALAPFLVAEWLSDEQGAEATKALGFDNQNTARWLAGTSIACPPLHGKLLQTYITHLIQSGFIDSPASSMVESQAFRKAL